MQHLFLMIGGITMALAVMLGAFGAHGLESSISAEMIDIFQTGVSYHFYHAIGLLIVGLVTFHVPDSGLLKWSGWFMVAGITIFSGSLYLLSLSGIRWLGAITPIGGLCFIIAWILFTLAVWKG